MHHTVTILEKLHILRGEADRMELTETSERLRLAIIEAAYELDVPTGLNVRDLIKGREIGRSS